MRRRGLLVAGAATATALAAAAAWMVWLTPVAGPLTVAVAAERAVEARLSWPGADRHRPLALPRAGEPPREAVAPSTLAALERRGDLRGVAAAALLAGDRAAAEAALARAGDSADVRSDRAAVALAAGRAAQALQLADAALTLAPAHPQASWNRALALRDLGLPLVAAAADDAVAALGEPGWSDEARARAATLRDEANRRARAWHALVVDKKVPPAAETLRASLGAANAATVRAEARRQGWWGVERDALKALARATPETSLAAAYATEASLRIAD